MSYFNVSSRFEQCVARPKDISSLLHDEMVWISGDFYGIQKFIFEGLSTQKAAKVLRAKSAFVQIFTEYTARYICHTLNVTEDAILSIKAGKFDILVPQKEIDLESIQKKLDHYFIQNFYGLSGLMLSSVACTRDDFAETRRYKALRKEIMDRLEEKKFQKFNLLREDASDVLNYDTNIDNQTLCPICNIRKIQETNENCSVCNGFVALGSVLARDTEEFTSSDLGIRFVDDFDPKIKIDNRIKSYIRYIQNEKAKEVPADFKVLADSSCKDMKTGIKALAVLKADVDNMGKFLEKSDVTNSFEGFDGFSKTIDNFFSLYIPKMMKENYPDTYTVFAGGDDLFLLGAWDEVLKLARKIEEEFRAFVKSDELSISFGIAIAKPSIPISYLADHTEHLLEEAKEIDAKKAAISLFGETVKWKDYRTVHGELYDALMGFKDHLNTAFLYRLLELIEMSKKVKYHNDVLSTMWKSKFRYSFNRNVLEKMRDDENKKRAEDILGLLGRLIDENPKETKMVLNEFIYTRRSAE